MKRKRSTCPYQLELALSFEDDAAPAQQAAGSAHGAADDASPPETAAPAVAKTCEPGLWRDGGWTARVIWNEDGEGWAVSLARDGEPEPALVAPWTAGRDGKSHRPLDAVAFATLVKAASGARRRHEQQMHALLHRSVVVPDGAASVTVTLDIVPDGDHAYAVLAAYDEAGTQLAQARVAPGFRLSRASAAAWVECGFGQPQRG